MSGQTPAQRLRTKTSDITDFFRGTGQSSTQTRRESTLPGSLEVPQSENEGGTGKKKITRIPLFGRTRKISTASSTSTPHASTSTSAIRPSSETTDRSSRAPSSDRERHAIENSISQSHPARNLPSAPSSFSSKLAARFNPSQSKKRPITSNGPVSRAASSSRTSLLSPATTGLAPPDTRPSMDSASTAGSKGRSTTPRPTRPMITVSMNDNMDQFKDLFTQEPPLPSSSKAPKPVSVSKNPSKRSPPPSPTTQQFGSVPSSYRRGQTPASALAAAVRDRQAAHERHSSSSSKSSRKTPESDKGSSSEKTGGRSTPRLSSARESPRPIIIDKEKTPKQSTVRRPSIVIASSSQLHESSSSSSRSRIKQPVGSARSKPPSIPLPQLPPNATPTSSPLHEFPPSPAIEYAEFSETESRKSRSRANTLSSIPDLPTVPPTPTPPKDSLEDKAFQTTHTSFVEDELFDIDTAPPEQLRRALRNRNRHFDELAALLLKKEEEWLAERKTLEKKVASLQRDLVRRESEITGLKLIINDEDILQRPKAVPPGIINNSRLSPLNTTVQDSDQETYSSPSSQPARRLHYASDSGAESQRASAGSGGESSGSHLRTRKIQRFSTVSELKYSPSARRAPRFPPGLHNEKSVPDASQTKRSSMLSTSSASSSSSSLLPPSPSVTMSSLSAIPEGNAASMRGFSSDSEDHLRTARAAHRISTSSMTSSSTNTSSSFSSNYKRSRPPSIAQVLDKSPNADNLLDKLRPFA